MRQNPWYERQEDIGLPMTFDEWRAAYDRLTVAEQVAYADAVYRKFPVQRHSTLSSAARFFDTIGPGRSVLELGGGDGYAASCLLLQHGVRQWTNLELSRSVVEHGWKDPAYVPVALDRFAWQLDRLPSADVFFASHVLEHVRLAEIRDLLRKLTGFQFAYVECPLPHDAEQVDWSGRWNTHILEVGWTQLEEVFTVFGFSVMHREGDVRWFTRSAKAA